MDFNSFWSQIFYPLNNFVEIFFAVLIALLIERIIRELEDANLVNIKVNPTTFFGHLSNFLIRFCVAFFIVFVIIFIIILIVAILMALFGFSLNFFNNYS